MLGTLLLASCGGERDDASPPVAHADRQPSAISDQGGRVVDLADALSPAERLALGRRLAYEQQADGRPVMVVILQTDKNQSLEQVGWAVSGTGGANRSFIILVDPEQKRVRLEGDLQPESKAAVAAAMRNDLAAGRVAAAIERGLVRLEQLAP